MACEALRVFRSGEGEEGERGLECERGKEGREKEGGRKGFYKRKRSYEKQKKKKGRVGLAGGGRGSARQRIGERLIATPLGRKVFPTLPPGLYIPSRFTTP